MRKRKLVSLAVGLALVFTALSLATPIEASHHTCWCEILCWYNGTEVCYQDSCCNMTCCDTNDPNCWTPC